MSVEDYLARIEGFDCGEFRAPSSCANPREARGYIEHQMAFRVGILF